MTVGELRAILDTYPDDIEVTLASDIEAHSVSPLTYHTEGIFVSEGRHWKGSFFDYETAEFYKVDGIKSVVFIPKV